MKNPEDCTTENKEIRKTLRVRENRFKTYAGATRRGLDFMFFFFAKIAPGYYNSISQRSELRLCSCSLRAWMWEA